MVGMSKLKVGPVHSKLVVRLLSKEVPRRGILMAVELMSSVVLLQRNEDTVAN